MGPALALLALIALGARDTTREAPREVPRDSVPRIVVLDSAVRAVLAAAWTEDPAQRERAYGGAYVPDRRWRAPAARVWAIAPAEIAAAEPNAVIARCPRGAGIVFLHTHPPATCDPTCRPGGPEAYECFPSDDDRAMLARSGDAFALVQCARDAVIFYVAAPTLVSPGAARAPSGHRPRAGPPTR